MSDEKLKPEEPETLACQVCLTEIPKDLASSEEGSEYVYHFCGNDCYDKWQKQDEKD